MKRPGARSFTAGFIVAATLAVPQSSHAAAFVVDTNVDSGPGSLRQAITDANATVADDVITFSLATPNQIELLTQLPAVAATGPGGKLTIQGPGASLLDIHRSSGAGAFPVITAVAGADLTVNELRISGGSSPSGGGILTAGAVTTKSVEIINNSATSSGGGAATISSGSLTLRQSTVSANQAGASGGGGVTANTTGQVTIERSTVSGNSTTALSGAGLRVDGPMTVHSSTIANNTGPSGTPLTGKNISVPVASGVLTLQNTIVADAQSTDPMESTVNCQATGGTITSLGYNMADDASCNLTETSDHLGVDPELKPLAVNASPFLFNSPPTPTPTHALPLNSPALDAGDHVSISGLYDQRGLTRPVDLPGIANAPGGNSSDIGSFELQASGSSVSGCGPSVTTWTFYGKPRSCIVPYAPPRFRCKKSNAVNDPAPKCKKKKKKKPKKKRKKK